MKRIAIIGSIAVALMAIWWLAGWAVDDCHARCAPKQGALVWGAGCICVERPNR